MALRRALVVDDSRTARIALKKQLESYGLSVDLADSGEEALEFLKYETVDVIFMDHIMPGMDGLEAVEALKSNPRTATIPVMMYTSKKGELYVSQARALGAVDVLPKQVQPGVLFNMLLQLGLVVDRRVVPRDEEEPDSREPESEDAEAAAETEGDEEPLGMPMQALLSRIVEDQTSALRSDLLYSQAGFARRVANEVVDLQKEREEAKSAAEEELPVLETTQPQPGSAAPMIAGALGIAALFFAVLFFQARTDRDAALEEANRQADAVLQERLTTAEIAALLNGEPGVVAAVAPGTVEGLVGALTWSLNESGAIDYETVPFNERRTEQLGGLAAQLANAGLRGIVRVESHLGEFCLASDDTGTYELAEPDLPVSACAVIGHPLDDSSLLSERQTPAFENFMAEFPLVNGTAIQLELVAHDRTTSIPLVPYPAEPLTAGEWNAVARRNNRLEYTLLLDTQLAQ